MAAVLTQEELYKKMISNMVEVRTRGAFVLAVTNEVIQRWKEHPIM